TELWRRTTIGIGRALAAQSGQSLGAFSRSARLSFVKIVEYQQRGAVHIHAVVRLDGRDGPDSAPPLGAMSLERSVRDAATNARVTYPKGAGVTGVAAWGRQIDIRAIATDQARAEVAAAYITT